MTNLAIKQYLKSNFLIILRDYDKSKIQPKTENLGTYQSIFTLQRQCGRGIQFLQINIWWRIYFDYAVQGYVES